VATPKILTIAEVAERLGMHPVTVYRLAKEGRLPVFRIGRMLRFDADELERWIRRGKVPVGRRRSSQTHAAGKTGGTAQK
jgi:putative molybdopterin biosynthesis protein